MFRFSLKIKIMERYIQQARSKMGSVETTTTQRYESQRVFLKQWTEVSRNVNNSLQRANKALVEFVAAIEGVHKSYEQVIGLGNHHETLVAVSTDFAKMLQSWKTESLPKFQKLLEDECLKGYPSLAEDHARVENLRQDWWCQYPLEHWIRQERRKLVDVYDYYRNEVLDKEKEYAKKNKPLSQSQTYAATVQKMEESQNQFASIAQAFDKEAIALLARKDVVTAHTLQCTLEHFGGVLGVFHSQLDRLFRLTAVHTHHIDNGYPTSRESIARRNSQAASPGLGESTRRAPVAASS